jgi:hypothetical protein
MVEMETVLPEILVGVGVGVPGGAGVAAPNGSKVVEMAELHKHPLYLGQLFITLEAEAVEWRNAIWNYGRIRRWTSTRLGRRW